MKILTVVTILVLAAIDGAVRLHLQVEALLAEQPGHNPFQLRLWRHTREESGTPPEHRVSIRTLRPPKMYLRPLMPLKPPSHQVCEVSLQLIYKLRSRHG